MREQARTDKSKQNMAPFLVRVLQGALIGVGAILPGVSGGVLSVVFGVYQPMMALLAHPVRTFRENAKLLFPILIGWAIGFLGLARGVEWMFRYAEHLGVWLFIGLIAGTFPALFKEAGKQGRPRSAWVTFGIVFTLSLALLLYLQGGEPIHVTPNPAWFLACGVLWGIAMVLPGMSPSSLLIFLGLYQPLAAGIADLDLGVVIPMLVGVAVVVVLSARWIVRLFERHYAIAFHLILGVVISSTLVIVPLSFSGVWDVVLSMLCLSVGVGIALWMERLSKKTQPQREQEEAQMDAGA